jgi:hypothetical protein
MKRPKDKLSLIQTLKHPAMKKYLLVATLMMISFNLCAQQKKDSAKIDYYKIGTQYIKASKIFYWPGTLLAGVGLISLIIAGDKILGEDYDPDGAADLARFGGCALLISIPFCVPAYMLEAEGKRYQNAGSPDIPTSQKKIELRSNLYTIPTGYSYIPVYSVGLSIPLK